VGLQSVLIFTIFMNFHFQYGGLKPEVVIYIHFYSAFRKFPTAATSPDITQQYPTPKKHLKSNMAAETEVVIAQFLLNIFEKFRRLGICFPAPPFKWTCRRHHPHITNNVRHPKDPIWRLGNRSSYIYTSSEDFFSNFKE